MKKLFAMVMIFIVVLGLLAGCGGPAVGDRFDDGFPGEHFEGEYDGEEYGPDGYEEPIATTVEEKVVYDDEIIKITVTGMDTETYGNVIFLFVTIENKTDDWFFMKIDDAIVNGITVPCNANLQVPGNESVEEEIRLERENFGGLDHAGIVNVHTIEFRSTYVAAMDYDQTKLCYPSFSVVTSLGSDYEQKINDSGEVIYDQNGIIVILQDMEPFYNGSSACWLVKNESGGTISVETVVTAFNGNPVPADDNVYVGMYLQRVYDGCPRYFVSAHYNTNVDESGETPIEMIEFDLVLYDTASGEEIGRIEGIVTELD